MKASREEMDGNWLGQHSTKVTEKWWDFSTAPQAQAKSGGSGEVPDMSPFQQKAAG
jgi:hypothetical protein